jgi:hypothetical protein
MSTPKYRRALAPALQAAPSIFPLIEPHVVRRQRVSPATMAWDLLRWDFATIEIREVDDRRIISREQAPATICNGLHRRAPDCTKVGRHSRLLRGMPGGRGRPISTPSRRITAAILEAAPRDLAAVVEGLAADGFRAS